MKYTPLFMALAFINFTNCQNKPSSEKNELPNTNVVQLNDAELQSLNIQTDTLHLRKMTKTLHFKGYIDVPPQNIYSMSVPLGGYLRYTHLLPGTAIKKGGVIAVLEDPQYIQLQENYLITKIQLSVLEKNYQRQKELAEQKAISEKIYEQAQAEYESAKVKLNSLEEKLHLLSINPSTLTASTISRTINIYAPFTGYVTKINFSTGKYIPPSDILFELVNPNDIHLNIKVFEKDLEYLKTGQKVYAYTNYEPQKKHTCEIILINKIVNPDRTIDVHCHFDQYHESLIPGTYMQADVFIENADIYTVPSSAVLFYNNRYFVFIQKTPNTFVLQEIHPTAHQDTNYTGIQNYQDLLHAKIVVKNAYALLMKLKGSAEE